MKDWFDYLIFCKVCCLVCLFLVLTVIWLSLKEFILQVKLQDSASQPAAYALGRSFSVFLTLKNSFQVTKLDISKSPFKSSRLFFSCWKNRAWIIFAWTFLDGCVVLIISSMPIFIQATSHYWSMRVSKWHTNWHGYFWTE